MKTITTSRSTVTRFGVILCAALGCVFLLGLAGCSHKKTNRGHLFRCDWAFEYNRTPWIGCPPDTGCDDEDTGCGCGTGGCLGGCKGEKQNKGFRRHCGLNPECTAKKPCCRTLGCGMWIDPSNPNSFAGLGTGVKACGMTPFCSPMKPCCLTPLCGKVSPMHPQMSDSQALMLGNQGIILPGAIQQNGTILTPTPAGQNGGSGQGLETPPQTPGKKPTTVAGPNGLLISMGIVPGVSTITSGGVVAAAGVTTPVGMMTPAGVQLPNGTLNRQVVIRACSLHPACNAGRPCGLSPACGTLVPIGLVSNNAVALASALSAPGISGGVMQAGGMNVPVGGRVNGMLVNPISGQPVYGLSMNGMPQAGYPPIGYTPSGYSPKYPRFDGLGLGMNTPMNQINQTNQTLSQEEDFEEEPVESPITKSEMPVPRFHPVPSKPAFQRSEGLLTAPTVTPSTTPRAAGTSRKVSANRRRASSAMNLVEDDLPAYEAEDGIESAASLTKKELDAAVKRAYLEGMSAAMDEVEVELNAKSKELENADIQAKVLDQAKTLQEKIDGQQQTRLTLQQERLAERNRLENIERQASFRAHQEAERQLQEESILQAQLREAQLQQAKLRQVQLIQARQLAELAQQNQGIQQAGFLAENQRPVEEVPKKGVWNSTLDFLKGHDSQAGQQGFSQQRQQQRQYVRQVTQPGIVQSAKSAGSELLAPIGALWGSSTRPQPKMQKQSGENRFGNSKSSQYTQNTTNTAYKQNTKKPDMAKNKTPSQTGKIRNDDFYGNYYGNHNHHVSIQSARQDCPTRPATRLTTRGSKNEKVLTSDDYYASDDFGESESREEGDQKTPNRPPTALKPPKSSKPLRNLAAEEESEDDGFMVRQAHYVEHSVEHSVEHGVD